jgi:hypothetical protein
VGSFTALLQLLTCHVRHAKSPETLWNPFGRNSARFDYAGKNWTSWFQVIHLGLLTLAAFPICAGAHSSLPVGFYKIMYVDPKLMCSSIGQETNSGRAVVG